MRHNTRTGRASLLLRRGNHLERASIALNRLWLRAGGPTIVLIAFLVSMAVAAVLTGEFPG